MKIYKITEASKYLGVSINTLKTLDNNGKIKSFKTSGGHRRFRQDDLDAYMDLSYSERSEAGRAPGANLGTDPDPSKRPQDLLGLLLVKKSGFYLNKLLTGPDMSIKLLTTGNPTDPNNRREKWQFLKETQTSESISTRV